jgi:hypothetical protein
MLPMVVSSSCVLMRQKIIKTSSKHTRFCVVVGAGGWRTEGSRKQGLPFLSDDRMPHLIITDPLMMGDLSGHEPKISLEIKKTDPLWTCS